MKDLPTPNVSAKLKHESSLYWIQRINREVNEVKRFQLLATALDFNDVVMAFALQQWDENTLQGHAAMWPGASLLLKASLITSEAVWLLNDQ